jgi:low affinity Fe/Cu permease
MPRKARSSPHKALTRKLEAPRLTLETRQSHQGHFERFACGAAHLAGRPAAFLIALATIIVWAITGPLFGFSDTWQLIINTSTTIITFLMVFLIQNTQNRDTIALQVKLDALIFATRGAKNRLAAAEHMSDEDLELLHDEYRKRAEHTLTVLRNRRPARANGKRHAA